MKRKICTIWLLLLLASTAAAAQDAGFGLGVIIGEPTGLSGKYWLTRRTAVDFAAAWSFADDGSLHLHGDWLMHRFDLIPVDEGSLPLYFGIGGRLRFSEDNGFGDSGDDVGLGLRIPVGLDYLFEAAPLDAFLEIVPILDLIPDSDVSLNASIGIRYWFE
jgi:hypothetical protein